MKTNITKVLIAFILLFLLTAGVAYGQKKKPRASQKGTVSQTVADTEISIEYSRPVARGRVLFGDKGIIKFDKMWMPGANEASNIRFSSDVLVNGKTLKAGRYSFWAIPNVDKWILILSKDWDQWHTNYPGEKNDALRMEIAPAEGSHMEVMAFYFPVVTADSATLNLHWGRTIIPFEIKLAN